MTADARIEPVAEPDPRIEPVALAIHMAAAWGQTADLSLARRLAEAALDAVDTIAAALPAPASRWQPIETAPKDGTVIDLWQRHVDGKGTRITYAKWCWGKDIEPGYPERLDSEGWRRNDAAHFPNITHWQSIPEPPTDE